MTYDFDTPLALRGTHSDKWDAMAKVTSGIIGAPDPAELIPMWVADMDFAAAPPIREAMQAEVERGYFGYFTGADAISDAVAGWLRRNHGWTIDPGHVRYTNGVVAGIALSISTFSEPGDCVVVFSPVYHAFYRKIRALGREAVESELVLEGGQYRMDLDALEARLTGREKLLILCTPHNPGGRIWTDHEIRDVAAFCARHNLILVSDEIHMDLVHAGHRFTPTAIAAPDCIDRLIVLTAASKGFNIAGGETGCAIVPDAKLRAAFDRWMLAHGGSPNRFGMLMLKAAFTHGDDWSAAVRAHISGNFAIWRDRISALPGIEVMDMNATYLTWVNFEGTGLTGDEFRRRVICDARIASSPGPQFGRGGETFERFNIAMPRPLLTEAISRMEQAFADLQ